MSFPLTGRGEHGLELVAGGRFFSEPWPRAKHETLGSAGGGDREHELDLADIGGEANPAAHGAKIASTPRSPKQSPRHSPPHSMTSLARPRSDSGRVRPSAFAVFRFTISSNLVGCWTGRSAGFSPFRILST